ncbi:hypothetical protein [Methylococcus sp. EFPC2]|uniref:hypothetical protein n=1 Tax=Methylococcus sp. EFPC2 TaxID=2812648 RepID=UPI0019681A8A|nr:hypothetical protein [Methylococcus sp. EFPC2]QSA95653.1 hypothetical protein JWZ97_10350 [Methylococcus sp. EFPC2]
MKSLAAPLFGFPALLALAGDIRALDATDLAQALKDGCLAHFHSPAVETDAFCDCLASAAGRSDLTLEERSRLAAEFSQAHLGTLAARHPQFMDKAGRCYR